MRLLAGNTTTKVIHNFQITIESIVILYNIIIISKSYNNII